MLCRCGGIFKRALEYLVIISSRFSRFLDRMGVTGGTGKTSQRGEKAKKAGGARDLGASAYGMNKYSVRGELHVLNLRELIVGRFRNRSSSSHVPTIPMTSPTTASQTEAKQARIPLGWRDQCSS